MKTIFDHYFSDGANKSAQAVLCLAQELVNTDYYHKTFRNIYLSRWENCRDQGYVITAQDPYNQHNRINLHIAWFEHRNSDKIHAIKWLQESMVNSVTIDNAEFEDIYEDKFDTSFAVNYNEQYQMAEWIAKEVEKQLTTWKNQ